MTVSSQAAAEDSDGVDVTCCDRQSTDMSCGDLEGWVADS